jgi:transposase
LCGRRKRGDERNALGRSRGGFTTKINARTNAEGLPIGIVITPGQSHDVTAFPALMQEIDCDPEQMLGDKGYDSEAVRRDIEQRNGEAVIPSTATRKIQHTVDKAVYALRNRIERFFNRAKNSRRVATRYDKLIESFAAFVLLARFGRNGAAETVRVRAAVWRICSSHRDFGRHCRRGKPNSMAAGLFSMPGWSDSNSGMREENNPLGHASFCTRLRL